MSRIAGFIAMFLMIATASTTMADDQNPRQRLKPGMERKRDAQNPKRPQVDLSVMIPKFIEKFDTDGDSKLDAKELTAFMQMLQERRGQMFRGGDMMQRRGAGAGKRGAQSTPGGDKPKRPAQ